MRFPAIFLTVALLTAININHAPGQDPTSVHGWGKLSDKSSSYRTFAKDLLDMAETRQRDPEELRVAYELSAIAERASDYLSAASDLLWIYDQITSPVDRATIRSYINNQLESYSRLLEHAIKGVNVNISVSTSAGIAATGTRLRDELRDGRLILKSVAIR